MDPEQPAAMQQQQPPQQEPMPAPAPLSNEQEQEHTEGEGEEQSEGSQGEGEAEGKPLSAEEQELQDALNDAKESFERSLRTIWTAFNQEVDAIGEKMRAELGKAAQACDAEWAKAQSVKQRLAAVRTNLPALRLIQGLQEAPAGEAPLPRGGGGGQR